MKKLIIVLALMGLAFGIRGQAVEKVKFRDVKDSLQMILNTYTGTYDYIRKPSSGTGSETDPIWLGDSANYATKNLVNDTASAIRADFPAGDAATITDVIYTALVTAIGAKTLTAGGWYRITDFQTVHYFTDGSTTIDTAINTGTLEPLILLATSDSTIDSQVYSPLFPQDEIKYDWNPDNWLADVSFSADSIAIVAGFKGVITFRKDLIKNLSTGYDFRNVKFRRWECDAPDYNAATVYSVDEICKSSGVIYKCIVGDSTDKLPADSTRYWQYLLDVSGDSLLSWITDSTAFNVAVSIDVTSFSDVYTFGTGCHDIDIGIISTLDDPENMGVFSRLNNIVFRENCYAIKLDPFCFFITYGSSCNGMTYGSSCSTMTYGSSCSAFAFGDNLIKLTVLDGVVGCSLINETDLYQTYNRTITTNKDGDLIMTYISGFGVFEVVELECDTP
jgi:hypothetical protein